MELEIGTRIALTLFGLGGVIALAIVPWVCIGTGLKNKNIQYH